MQSMHASLQTRLGCSLFVVLMWVPIVQRLTGIVPAFELSGVETPRAAVEPSLRTWSEGLWQASVEADFVHHLGMRDWMVRTDNEIRLRTFGVAKRPVVQGKDGWLFEEAYLPAQCLVQHRVLAEHLLVRCYNLRRLQDALAGHGIALVVLISPSKTFAHPDVLPAEFRLECDELRQVHKHYDVMRKGLEMAGVNFVDCVEFARQLASESEVGRPPMFVRSGIHWTNYGAARAAVHLLDRLEHIGNVDLRNLDVVGVNNGVPDQGELDLANLANLLDVSRWQHPLGQPILQLRD